MQASLRRKLLSTIQSFRKETVLVVGDVMLDLYIQGPPRSVSQEAPVIIIQAQKKFYKLGGAANVADNIHALGGKAILAGIIGDHHRHEDYGKSLLETLHTRHVNTEGIFVDHTRPTTVKMRVMSQGQQIVRVDEEIAKPITKSDERKLLSFLRLKLPVVNAVLISDYNKGVITKNIVAMLVKEGHRRNLPVLVDPKPQHTQFYRGVDCLTPNEVELAKMFGVEELTETSLRQCAQRLQRENAIHTVLLTRGANGMDIFQGGKRRWHIPALATKVVDVSGAGDTVAAVLSLSMGSLTPYQSAYLAAIAAKIGVEKVGTATVTPAELHEELSAQ